MKKLILTTCLVIAFTTAVHAQFHFELGVNFNSPQGDFGNSYELGVGAYVEPKYAITENIDLGLLIARNGFAGADVAGGSVDAIGALSILPTATYRFLSGGITPYAGIGVGMYAFEAASITVGNQIVQGESNTEFGFAPRAGIYLGRINLGAAYNIVSDANFIQFNLGVRILGRG